MPLIAPNIVVGRNVSAPELAASPPYQSVIVTDTSAAGRDAAVRELLQLALIRAAARDGARAQVLHPAVADMLRGACEKARTERLRAEQLVIMLKQSWRHLAEEQVLERTESVATLNAVVTRCIKEYYRSDTNA